jgi:uncharacterized membrane protein (DUF485 family)
MSVKRKLLLSYAVSFGGILTALVFEFYLNNSGVAICLLLLAIGLRSILRPSSLPRIKLSSYGLAAKIYASILGVYLVCLVFFSFYNAFINQKAEDYLIKYGIWVALALLLLLIPFLIMTIYKELKLASEKDKTK